jgi:hypothetical protein
MWDVLRLIHGKGDTVEAHAHCPSNTVFRDNNPKRLDDLSSRVQCAQGM